MMKCPECGHHIVEHGWSMCYADLPDPREACACKSGIPAIAGYYDAELIRLRAECEAAYRLIVKILSVIDADEYAKWKAIHEEHKY